MNTEEKYMFLHPPAIRAKLQLHCFLKNISSQDMDNPIVRWKLDGVLVQEYIPQEGMDLPANTELSYTTTDSFGIHELKIEAEKNDVLVSKSWTWNVDEIVSSCSNSYMSTSGNVYITIKNATLYKRSNGTHSIDIDWYVGACQSIAAGSYNFSPVTYGPACKMIVTVGVYWNSLTYPEAPADNILQQVQETNIREASEINTFDNVYRECTAFVKVDVECYAHPVFHIVTPVGEELNIVLTTEIVTAAKENGDCACSL